MPSLVVRPFVADDYVALATAQALPAGDLPGLAADLAASGPAFTGLVDGDRAACAGVQLLSWPGVGKAWALIGSQAFQHPIFLTRAVVRGLLQIIDDHQLVRVEADVLATGRAACRWLEYMGFESEGLMRKRGPGGVDMQRYALLPRVEP